MVYHNLVDLRLEFAIPEEGEISMLQLANILAASPGLAILKLEEMTITPSDNWKAEKVVRLAHLELLYLKGLTYDSWVALPLVLSLSDCPDTLEVGIHHGEGVRFELSQRVQDFLRGAHIKTLGICLLGTDDNPQWALSLPRIIPSLENLILPSCNLLNLRGSEEVVEELEANTIAPSCLPHLFLVSSNLDLGKLKSIVSVYRVGTLHLDGLFGSYGLDSGSSKAELRTALLESFPSLECTISDEDTTRHWPCRRMFDW
ncbi:hypothetical protein FRC12_021763 [Ceratobasidium sp. 428]|nr:hypothetical protein FRC12_021763 [Ceratobasidium sp. 428]